MEKELLSKFSNVYIMLLYAIMTNDIKRVKHFISDELYLKYKDMTDKYISNNETRIFGEPNVYQISIINKEIKDDYEYVTVKLVSRYMDYVIDNETKMKKYGIDNERITKDNILVFRKNINAKPKDVVYTCNNCGSNLDINFNGVCPYCQNSADLSKTDYILVSLEN